MAVADRAGLPVAVHTASATPHEVTLVPATLAATFTTALPERLIGEKAYDSDPLDVDLAQAGMNTMPRISWVWCIWAVFSFYSDAIYETASTQHLS